MLQALAISVGIKSTALKKHYGNTFDAVIEKFVATNSYRVIQFATLDDKSISKSALELKRISYGNKDKTYLLERKDKKPYYIYNGKLILFVKDRLQEIDGQLTFSEPLTDIWDDVLPNDLHNEGGVEFRKGKKPEKLIQRIMMLASNEGDLVLDSFLGSGSTAAVAIKMKRKWIGIELGEHAKTHCVPRLQSVVQGEQKGISKAVEWQGGGGFKFYTLAPSLLNKDKYDNWVISKEYNPDMLAAAMAKQSGFRYEPDGHVYWKQGRSSEKDYIYTTTQFMTVEMLEKIREEMGPDESLMICAKIYQRECENRFANITVKKIPQMLLGKCEFGKEDYSFNIVNLPHDDSAAPSGDEAIDERIDENPGNEPASQSAQTNLFY